MNTYESEPGPKVIVAEDESPSPGKIAMARKRQSELDDMFKR